MLEAINNHKNYLLNPTEIMISVVQYGEWFQNFL